MVILRALTDAEREMMIAKIGHYTGRTGSLLWQAVGELVPGQGILISHEGQKCIPNNHKEKTSCTISGLLTRAQKKTGYRYTLRHTNGRNSDVMILCMEKAPEKAPEKERR